MDAESQGCNDSLEGRKLVLQVHPSSERLLSHGLIYVPGS
jgi:hypothetical protein